MPPTLNIHMNQYTGLSAVPCASRKQTAQDTEGVSQGILNQMWWLVC
jgi:hypothetical protein